MEFVIFLMAIAMAMVIGVTITWQFAKWWFTSTTTAPQGRKRMTITFGAPLADTNVVRRATWVMSEVPKGLKRHHDYRDHDIVVETSLVQHELVVISGDVTPEQASRIIAWITQFAVPR